MDYHLFRKTVVSRSKKIKKWYYWYYNQNGQQVQRVCKKCATKMQAEEFLLTLPNLSNPKIVTIRELTQYMFVYGSTHMKRREQYGRSVKEITILEWRRYLNVINDNFGNVDVTKLTAKDFMSFVLLV